MKISDKLILILLLSMMTKKEKSPKEERSWKMLRIGFCTPKNSKNKRRISRASLKTRETNIEANWKILRKREGLQLTN